MSASFAYSQRAFRNGNEGSIHARSGRGRRLVGFSVLLAIAAAVVSAPRSFSRVGLDQERRQFEALSAALVHETKVDRETLDGLAALLKDTASDCKATVVCNGTLKERYLHARAMLDEEIRNRRVLEP